MAEGVDIDLYDNLEEDFNQDADFNHDSDLYDDVITAPASQEDMELYSHGVDPEAAPDTRDHDRTSTVYFARNRHGEIRHDAKSTPSAPIMPANYTGKRVSLYVGNLTWWTTDQDLTDIIATIGVPDLLEIKFYENRANGQSKGFAVVAVGSEASSRAIFEKLPKKKIHSQIPIVTHCNRTTLHQFEAQARKGEPPPPTGGMKEPNSKPNERGGPGGLGAGGGGIGSLGPAGLGPGGLGGNRRDSSRYISRNSRTTQSSPQQGTPGPPGPPPPSGPPAPYNAFRTLKRAWLRKFIQGPPRPGGPPPPPVPPPPGVPLVGPPPRQPGGPPPPGMPPRAVPPPQRGPPPPDPRLAPPRPDWDRPTDHRPHPNWNPMVPFPGSASSSALGQHHPPGTSFNGNQAWKGGPPLHQPPPVSAPPPGHPPAPAPHVNPAFFPPQHGQPPPAGPMIPVGQFETLPPFLDPDVKFHTNHPPHSQPGEMYVRPPPPAAYPNDPYGRPPERHESASPAISEQEFEEIFQRNKTVSSSAISRAVQDASAGDFASAIETLVTAISLIKQSKIAGDDRCKILISSLQDTLHGIEEKSYGSKSSTRRSRSRERERDRDREKSSRRHRSRSRDREYRERSRDRDRYHEERHRDRDRERERERDYRRH
ncbi:cleavage and polyadenylation specificity factor subunit 6-like [Argonauta hians]